jgi:hypothetical protein
MKIPSVKFPYHMKLKEHAMLWVNYERFKDFFVARNNILSNAHLLDSQTIISFKPVWYKFALLVLLIWVLSSCHVIFIPMLNVKVCIYTCIKLHHNQIEIKSIYYAPTFFLIEPEETILFTSTNLKDR